MLQYHPNNPLRPTDWRWERARIIRENSFTNKSTTEDEWINISVKFQKALAKVKTEYGQYELVNKYPDLYFAYALRGDTLSKNTEKPSQMKHEVEARLLAREPYEQIADRIGCTAKVIEFYEKLFYNVVEKINNTSYILHQAIGPAIYRGMYEKDHDLLWKLYGYFCGSKALDALITTFTKPVLPETDEQVDAMFVDDTRSVMRRKAAIAARTVAVNQYTQLKILEIYTKFLEIENDTAAVSGENLLLSNISELMSSLPWAAGSETENKTNPHLLKYDNQSAELRADEILAISFGKDNVIDAEFENLKFPEVIKNEEVK